MNASPLSVEGWQKACETAGLAIERCETGPMSLLNPRRIAQEEGFSTLLTMGWNVLTRPVLRQRILAMRKTFVRHGDDLGYVVFCAKKEG
ncbi:MAG: hypothetical protein AAFX40_14870 [Cyanobacteria bacterium J06639_1]